MADDDKTVAETLTICSRITSFLDNLTRVYVSIARTIASRRTPSTALITDESYYNAEDLRLTYGTLENVVYNGIRFVKATKAIIRNFETVMQDGAPGEEANITYLPITDIQEFGGFWNNAQSVMESTRKRCLDLLRYVFQLELEKSTSYYATWNVIEEQDLQLEKTAADLTKFQNLHELHYIWSSWLKIAPLVIEYEPSCLTLDAFLDTTDAIHLYHWTIFAKIYQQPGFSANYLKLAEDVINRGFPGPQYMLEADKKGADYFKRTNVYLFARNMFLDFTKPFFSEEFYERLTANSLRKIVPLATELYSEMKRSLCHHFAWFWGKDLVERKMREALNTIVGLTFIKCLEIIRNSRSLAQDMRNRTQLSIMTQALVARDLPSLAMGVAGLVDEFISERNFCLSQLVTKHYEEVRNVVTVDLARFFVHASQLLERKGYTYYDLPLPIRLDVTNLVVCYRELVNICDRAAMYSQPGSNQLALVEWAHVAHDQFMDTEKSVLANMKSLPHGRNPVNAREIFCGFFLTPELRKTAEDIMGIPADQGRIAPSRDVNPYVPMEIKFLGSEPTNPADESLMEDDQFRRLLKREIDLSGEVNVGNVEFS